MHRSAVTAALLLCAVSAAPTKRKLSLPRLGLRAARSGAPFLTSQPLLNLLLGIRLRYASWGAPVAHWWPRGGPSSRRASQIDAPKAATDLRDPAKTILVVTTASVPWLTGTAINPLLRAAHLARMRPEGHVCLYLPWLEPDKQHEVYGATAQFKNRADHARFVYDWLRDVAHLPDTGLRIAFYDAHYHRPQGSIYPMGRTVEALARPEFRRYSEAGEEEGPWRPDATVLEEPEHLNWYSYVEGKPSSWRSNSDHVIGVVHTHYVRYAATERMCPGPLGYVVHPIVGPYKACAALLMARWMTNGHCHRIIKLSGTLPRVGNDDAEIIANVHGVRGAFLDAGAAKAVTRPYSSADDARCKDARAEPSEPRTKGAYFIGKLLWQKGLGELASLLVATSKEFGGDILDGDIHIVGDGKDRQAIEKEFKRRGVPSVFHGRVDHGHELCRDFRVLVNPSKTEVLCTTVAEALAMGKWVLVARHPSNEFFYDFPTCLSFASKKEFAQKFAFCVRHEPPSLSVKQRRRLSWAAATERFCDASLQAQSVRMRFHQKLACFLHVHLGRDFRGDVIRSVAGAGLDVGRQTAYVRARERLSSDSAAEAPEEAGEAPDAAEVKIYQVYYMHRRLVHSPLVPARRGAHWCRARAIPAAVGRLLRPTGVVHM